MFNGILLPIASFMAETRDNEVQTEAPADLKGGVFPKAEKEAESDSSLVHPSQMKIMQLEAEREAQRKALVAAGMGTFTYDVTGRRFTTECGLSELLGFDPADWDKTRQSLLDRSVHPVDRERVRTEHASANLDPESKEQHLEFRIRRPNNEIRWISQDEIILRDPLQNNIAVERQGRVTDITERKKMEELVLTLQQRLQQAHGPEVWGRMAGLAAQAIKSTLQWILGNADELERHLMDMPLVQRHIHAIREGVATATKTINELLVYNPDRKSEVSEVQLNDILKTFLSDVLAKKIMSPVAVDANLASSLGTVKADPEHIKAVVLDLVLTLRSGIFPASGVIAVKTSNVKQSPGTTGSDIPASIPPGQYIALQISRETPGVSNEKAAPALFDPYTPTKEMQNAERLQLAAAHETVKHNKGYLLVRTSAGHGQSFTVLLPRTDKQIESEKERTILVVDDDEKIRQLVALGGQSAFRSKRPGAVPEPSYRVIEARDGQEALAILEKQSGDIDLVLTDIMMTEMDGITLSREVQKRYPGLAIAYMSAIGKDYSVVQPDPSIPLLSKPFGMQDLLVLIGSIFKHKKE